MSLDGVGAAQRIYEVFDSDLDALVELVDPDIDWISPDDAIEPGLRRGPAGVRAAFADTAAAWDRPTHTPEDFAANGDRVLVTITFRGHGRGSGMEAERTEFHLWTFRDGIAVRFHWFYQRSDALAAAGLEG
jgi:ketosteroid isomerase-like protein